MRTIFIIDDNDVNLITASNALSKQYRVFTLPSAADMFELLENIIPDLILLDIMMPEINGFEAMKMLKDNVLYMDIPVIFLSSRNDSATESHGFEMGAIDFISKPFSEPVLLNRLKTHLNIEALIRERTEQLQQQTEKLHLQTEKLQQRTEKLQKLQNSLVFTLANMVESRDRQTGRHIERTTKFVELLLEAMLERGMHTEELEKWNLDSVVSSARLHDISEIVVTDGTEEQNWESVVSSARLHDIGKIAVTDLVLNKPGSLTREEFEVMKLHASEGEKIIDSIIAESGNEAFLQSAKLFAGYHHEWWDGTGYPRGLKGNDIPLLGRIMALADVYDALMSDRSYKRAFSHDEALDIIKTSSGSHFDPDIVDLFLEINELFKEAYACL